MSGKQIKADAAWYRAEAARLRAELDAMTPARVAAYGAAAVQRMHVDHDTFIELAEEHEQHLARFYPDLVEQQDEAEAPGLF